MALQDMIIDSLDEVLTDGPKVPKMPKMMVTETFWQSLKAYCAINKISMGDFVLKAIVNAMRQDDD